MRWNVPVRVRVTCAHQFALLTTTDFAVGCRPEALATMSCCTMRFAALTGDYLLRRLLFTRLRVYILEREHEL